MEMDEGLNLPFLLADARVNSNTGEVAVAEELIQSGCAHGALDENDDLVELQAVEKLVELAVLLLLTQFDVVLLKTVEGELRLVVNVDFEWVAHELLADRANFLRQGGAEHHDLLLGGSSAEDLLDVAAHI